MRRWARPALLVAVIAIVAAWLLPGRDDSGPAGLTLAQLAVEQEDHDGRRVRTVGVVRRFGPEDGATHLHYVVEDAAANRVELAGGNPAPFVGRRVEVVGRFHFREGVGRTIDVERIEPR